MRDAANRTSPTASGDGPEEGPSSFLQGRKRSGPVPDADRSTSRPPWSMSCTTLAMLPSGPLIPFSGPTVVG